ncbi:MAG TPA: ECF transporter S component [Roseiflexaceae bacterium]
MAITTQRSERASLSGGQIVLAVSALLLVVAFFLPWVNTGAGNPSGLSIASGANVLQPLGIANVGLAGILYLVPVLAVAALALAFVRQSFAGLAAATAAGLAFLALVVFLVQLNSAPVIADAVTKGGSSLPFYGFGLWIALVAAFGTAAGGAMIAYRYLAPGAELTTRRIVTAGMLGAIAITLGVTRLGFIPVPNVSGNATIMHVPAIIGAVLEGPVVGVVTGGIFGLFSMLQDTTGLFGNPLVSVVPRLFIGLTAWLAYRSLAGVNRDLAAAVAGVVGTLTNTILVVGMLVALGLIPFAVVPTIVPQAIAELVVAAVLTPIVVRGVNITRSGRTSAEDTVPREKSYF